MCEDALQLLPLEKWADLQELFLSDFPRSISGYAMLETQTMWLENGSGHGFKVYCPYGDFKNGMVAFNKKDVVNELVILCPTNDTSNIENALRETKLINWNEFIIVPFAPKNIYDCLQRVKIDATVFALPGEKSFFKDINSPLYNDISLPPEISFGLVSPEHIELIDSVWPHRYHNSQRYFQLLIRNDCGYGLFKNNELISWVFVNEAGNLLHMFTLEEHRRKGYAELLLKLLVNDQLKKKRYVIAYCVKGNYTACELYTKLGFTSFDHVTWCFYNKM